MYSKDTMMHHKRQLSCEQFARNIDTCFSNTYCKQQHNINFIANPKKLCENYITGECLFGLSCPKIHSVIHAVHWREQNNKKVTAVLNKIIHGRVTNYYEENPIYRWTVYKCAIDILNKFIYSSSVMNIIKDYICNSNRHYCVVRQILDYPICWKQWCSLCNKKNHIVSHVATDNNKTQDICVLICPTCYELLISYNLMKIGLSDFSITKLPE